MDYLDSVNGPYIFGGGSSRWRVTPTSKLTPIGGHTLKSSWGKMATHIDHPYLLSHQPMRAPVVGQLEVIQ